MNYLLIKFSVQKLLKTKQADILKVEKVQVEMM